MFTHQQFLRNFFVFLTAGCMGYFCPCFLLCDISSRMGEGCLFPCCCPGALTGLRVKLRVQQNIQVKSRLISKCFQLTEGVSGIWVLTDKRMCCVARDDSGRTYLIWNRRLQSLPRYLILTNFLPHSGAEFREYQFSR